MDGSQRPLSKPIWDITDIDDTPSIILVQNIGVAYPDRREDPIFSSDKTYDNGTWFYNTKWHAGVIGCVDRTTICSPNGTVCGSLQYWAQQKPDDTDDFRVTVMLFWSLLYSNMGFAMQYRAAGALDAQTKLVAGVSLQLALEQWKIEVLQLFRTSLARIQIDARNIARGPPSGNTEGLQSFMHPLYEGMCRMYKFNSIGWRNVTVSAFLWAIGAGLLFIILGLHGEDEELWIEGLVTAFKHGLPQGTTLSKRCREGLKNLVRYIWTQLSKERPKLRALCWRTLGLLIWIVERVLKFLDGLVGGFRRGILTGSRIGKFFTSGTRRRQETTVEL